MNDKLDRNPSIRFDDRTLRILDQVAASEDLSRSELIRQLVKKHLEEQDEEILIENLKEKVKELNPDWPEEELEGKSAAYLSGVIEQTQELQEKYGKDSRDDSGIPSKARYLKDKQAGLQSKYQENFNWGYKIAKHGERLKQDGVLPQGLDLDNPVEIKRWCLSHKKELNDAKEKIERLG